MSDVSAPSVPAQGVRVRTVPVLLQGLLGSVALVFGSFGVGWLAPGSALNRTALFITLRTSTWGVVLCTVVLTLACWLLFRAWLRLGTLLRSVEHRLRTVVLAICAWAAPQLLCLPIFSRDIFAYIGQGRLVLAGQDPYQHTISAMNNWFQLGTDVTWADTQTAYGPMFYWIEAAVVRVTGDNTEAGILLFRLVAMIGVLLCVVAMRKLAELHGIDPSRALWLAVANPLFLISFVASGHNDALMVGLALAATYYAARRNRAAAVLLITASIAIKPITVILLPFIGLLLAGAGAGWGRRVLAWVYVGGVTLVLMTVMGWVGGFGFGWVSAMFGAGSGATFFAPLGALNAFLSGILLTLGIPPGGVLPVLKLLGRAASLVAVAVLIFRGRPEHLVQRMTLAFAAVVVLSPVIQPWYLLWLLPFFAATGVRDDWQTLWVYLTVAFFLGWGAMDQLYVWQFMSGMEPVMRQLVVWLSVACFAALAILDPGTRTLFSDTLPRRAWQRWRTRRELRAEERKGDQA